MHRKGILLLLIIFAIGYAGCVDIDVNTKINPDGSGLQKWKFTTTALISSQLKRQVEKDPFFQNKNAKIVEEFVQGDYVLTVEMPFTQVQELNSTDHEVSLEKKGILRTTYTYTENWKRHVDPDAAALWKGAGSLVPVTLRVSVEMPGRIIKTNAETVEGDIAKWSIPISDIVESKSLEVQSRKWNFWLAIPLAAVLVVGLLALIVVLSRKPSTASVSRTGSGTCSSCGAVVPPGSAFCNACGKKL